MSTRTNTNGQGDLLTRIRGELRGERTRLEGELATVRQVQKAIDPRTRPRKKRKVAAVGDRYDFSIKSGGAGQ